MFQHTVYSRRFFLIGALFIAFIVAGGVAARQLQETQSAGTGLTIPTNIPAFSGNSVTVPVSFASDGDAVSSMVFSIDYDETLLSFDSADADGDALPDQVTINIPSTHVGSIVADVTDHDGELDVTIFDASVPLARYGDGVVVEITFDVAKIDGAATAFVNFSSDPPVSFGDINGQAVDGQGTNGSVVINTINGGGNDPIITDTPSPTATMIIPGPSDTPSPTPSLAATTVTPSPTSSPSGTPSITPSPTATIFPTRRDIFLPAFMNGYPVLYSISGRVADGSGGGPLEGVLLTTNDGRQTSTDVNGRYIFQDLPAGSYQISPSLVNYQFTSRNLFVSGNLSNIDFVGLSTLPPLPPVPTPTPTKGSSSSPKPNPTSPPPAPTATLAGSISCGELLSNGGFESQTAWQINLNEYVAGYSTTQAYAGNHSMRIGIVDGIDNRFSYSSVEQAVTIPADALSVKLEYWIYPQSTDLVRGMAVSAPMPAQSLTRRSVNWDDGYTDAQYTLIIDAHNQLHTQISEHSNASTWQRHEFDLTRFRGQTVRVYFGVYNNGYGGITSSHIDNVSVSCS